MGAAADGGEKIMFCRNCGNQMDPAAMVCLRCGVKKGVGDRFCPNCGAQTFPGAAICTHCGVKLNNIPAGVQQKSKIVAGILGILLGGLGIHNFYLGYIGKGIAQICLTFCFGIGYIWGLIEGILILVGKIDKDANGIPLGD